jgi:hypothetical protein
MFLKLSGLRTDCLFALYFGGSFRFCAGAAGRLPESGLNFAGENPAFDLI